jgi:transposase
LSQYSIRESKIIKIENEWYIFITIEKQDEPIPSANNALAIDLGCKNIAVTVNTTITKPNFYGARLRGIRLKRNYAVLLYILAFLSWTPLN